MAAKTLSNPTFSKLKKAVVTVVSIACLLLLWELISYSLTESVLPSPVSAAEAIVKEFERGKIWGNLGMTLSRVGNSFVWTMIVGVSLGCILGLISPFKTFFNSWIVFFSSVPPLVCIVVVYMGCGLNEASVTIATVLTTVFTVAQNIEEGVHSIDRKLIEMGRTFNVSRTSILVHIIIPQVCPYIVASIRFSVSLIFKMVIFVELLGRSNGIGYMIQYWYSLNKMEYVLGYAVIFIIVALLFEFLMCIIVEPLLFRWRPKKK